MRKTDKKIENNLRLVLTDVCDLALKEIEGFQWLTHLVNYSNFPKSLRIFCIFDTNEHLACFLSNTSKKQLLTLIQVKLNGVDIELKNVSDHIFYDTEENCQKEHHGKWADRLG